MHQTLTRRRSQSLARIDAMLEILGPAWLGVFGADLSNKTPLRFLAAGYACPHTVKRLGKARVARFLYRHSRGRWGEEQAEALLEAAAETLILWADDLEFGELADDIAIEARLALSLGEELKDLDERIAIFLAEADPTGILTSVPGIGRVLGAQILGRLGDPNRFRTLAGVRSFSGLVPSLDASGMSGRHGGPTKRGDACLREAVFMAADQARRCDPSLAARYHRLMVEGGKHHTSALCHVAAALLTRIVACWRAGERYVIRDVDGTVVDLVEGKRIVAERYTVPADLRAVRRAGGRGEDRRGTDRRSKGSLRAPSTGPSLANATALAGA
jgi:hypothetical protein